MDKISGYVVANDKGGYDVITKTSQAKPFVIPGQEVPSPSGKKIRVVQTSQLAKPKTAAPLPTRREQRRRSRAKRRRIGF